MEVNLINFLNISQQYSSLYAQALKNSLFSFIPQKRKEYLIRNSFGVKTIELFFTLSKRLQISQLLECGANDASVSRRFIEETKNGSSLALEANPYVFNKFWSLNSNIQNLTYRNVGVSNSKGKFEFFIPNVTDKEISIFGSFQKLPQYYADYTSIKVGKDKLDNLIKLSKASASIGMWIDVEGEAFRLFEGAKTLLKSGKIKLIYVEVQEASHYQDEKNAYEISEYLKTFNFVPVARDFPFNNIYNLVFLDIDSLSFSIEILNEYWFSLFNIKAPYLEIRFPKEILSRIKNNFIRFLPNKLIKIFHVIFAMLGSQSSKKIIALK